MRAGWLVAVEVEWLARRGADFMGREHSPGEQDKSWNGGGGDE